MIRRVTFRLVAVPTMMAVALAGCANYAATLQYPSGEKAEDVASVAGTEQDPRFVLPEGVECGPDAVLALPKPAEAEIVVSGEPRIDDPSGWVHFRFDVDEQGSISNIEIVRSSSSRLEFAAKQLLNEWQFEPATADGKQVAFTDMEIVMGFSETTTPGEALGIGVAVIVLLPLALCVLALGAAAGVSNAIEVKR